MNLPTGKRNALAEYESLCFHKKKLLVYLKKTYSFLASLPLKHEVSMNKTSPSFLLILFFSLSSYGKNDKETLKFFFVQKLNYHCPDSKNCLTQLIFGEQLGAIS